MSLWRVTDGISCSGGRAVWQQQASRVLLAAVFATVCRVRLDERRRFCGFFFPNKYCVGLEAVSSQNGQINTAAFQMCGWGKRSLHSRSALSGFLRARQFVAECSRCPVFCLSCCSFFLEGGWSIWFYLCWKHTREIIPQKLEVCPYEKRTVSGVVSLISLNPGSKPSVKPCYIPAIWTNVRARAANPTRQLPLDKTLALCNKIRGKAWKGSLIFHSAMHRSFGVVWGRLGWKVWFVPVARIEGYWNNQDWLVSFS